MRRLFGHRPTPEPPRTQPGPPPPGPAGASTTNPTAWCGASAHTGLAHPMGPCVLRAGHDGPVHQGADGAKWWPADAGPPPTCPARCLIAGEPAPWQCQRPAGHRGIHEQRQPDGVREWHEYDAVYPTTPTDDRATINTTEGGTT